MTTSLAECYPAMRSCTPWQIAGNSLLGLSVMTDPPSYAADGDAIVTAAYEGDFELVKALVDEGADLDTTDESGTTAIMVASEHGYDAIVDFLRDNGANINAKDSDGDTALVNRPGFLGGSNT